VTQTILFRRLEQNAEMAAAYPFNRAARLELAGRASRLAFDRVSETTVSSLAGAEVVDRHSDTTPIAPPLLIGTARAALVFDTSDLGAISPVRGQRYRLEAAPTTGTIDFVNVLADYRRYIMPAPFYTIALRVLHSGRYGSGAEDSRLLPFYVGNPSLVRGYDAVPLDAGACAFTLIACPLGAPLMGSRALVGNLEFRMPLLRPLGTTRRMYSPLPTELAVFADAGTAWNRGERPAFLGGERTPAASAGLTVRTNVRGLAIAAFTIARPLNRPDRDWVFQFNLAPGF
jgi:outer membrane protein assembly factor BamA